MVVQSDVNNSVTIDNITEQPTSDIVNDSASPERSIKNEEHCYVNQETELKNE